jgi:phthalate 4,5-dioxygenase oxygenase subunit
MLTQEENELMCRIGPGTMMGTYLRRFWFPALMSEELPEPDCPPIRVRLMGEDLVAFRDTDGNVGLIDNYCPHRRASLFFGRNEECGLRCVYHGWKFDVNGDCVDMPSEPAESNFKDKVKVTAYPTKEQSNFVWAYMGPTDKMPEMPDFEWMHVPDENRGFAKFIYESNFVQSVEGEIDTVHASFLHSNLDAQAIASTATTSGGRFMYNDRWANFFVKEKDYGLLIGARRPADADSYYWRISQWMFPFYTMTPREPGTGENSFVRCRMWVPRDDDSTWVFLSHWHPLRPMHDSEMYEVNACRNLEPGKWIGKANLGNDYLIDREMQKTKTYAGLPRGTGRVEDAAMIETMGSVVDRSFEHLGTSDTAIIAMRRRLVKAARDLEEGIEPASTSHPEHYWRRSSSAVLPRDVMFDEDTDVMKEVNAKA